MLHPLPTPFFVQRLRVRLVLVVRPLPRGLLQVLRMPLDFVLLRKWMLERPLFVHDWSVLLSEPSNADHIGEKKMSDLQELNTISRRRFIKLAGAVGIAGVSTVTGAGPVLAADRQAADTDGSVIIGTVIAAERDSLVVEERDNRRSTVHLAPARYLYAGAAGEVEDGTGFIVGDLIAAEGRWDRSRFIGAAVGSVLQPVDFVVNSFDRVGQRVHTNIGVFELEGAEPGRRLSMSLPSGTRVRGLSWEHPKTQQEHLLIVDDDAT